MNFTYLHYQIATTLLYGVGPKRTRKLIESLGGIAPIFEWPLNKINRQTGFNISFLEKMDRKQALRIAADVYDFVLRHEIEPLFYDNQAFPRRLKECPDAPLLLYKKGNANLNPERVVAIVGTRTHTDYGHQICEELVQSLADEGITVVSGLALGIDALAHRMSLSHGLPTIAVLGHGLDRIYPHQHRLMAKEIVENGALLTEFVPGTKPDRENFPMRNRIVAGMCDATIVVESKESGGSLITARLANEYNRDVCAFPGSVRFQASQGCNLLIQQQQAHLIQSGQDFLSLMGWDTGKEKNSVQRKWFVELDDIQRRIYEVLTDEMHIDILSHRVGLTISELQVQLLHLELEGVIRQLPGNRYRRN